jgi:hypothetical protein
VQEGRGANQIVRDDAEPDPSETGDPADAGGHAARRDALEYAIGSQGDPAQPDDHQSDLGSVSRAAPSHGDVRALAGSVLGRQSS